MSINVFHAASCFPTLIIKVHMTQNFTFQNYRLLTAAIYAE